VRFVAGCTKGHLQDIDWRWLLHTDGSGCRQPMWLVETSTSADPRDTRIECECGVGLTLEELFLPGRLGPCRSERPWIGERDPAHCDAQRGLRLLTRSATNTYFPQVVSVISLPQSEDALSQRIAENLATLSKAKNAPWIGIARDANPALGAALDGYADEEVFARLQQMLADVTIAEQGEDPKLAEFALFSSGRPVIGENVPKARLHAETLPRTFWDPDADPLLAGIGSLVAVHRLREVSCLYGFTRFEPAPLASDDLEDVGLAVEGAALARAPTWLPAVESFGEGIFLTFLPAALAAWLERPTAGGRFSALANGVARWRAFRVSRGLEPGDKLLGERHRPEFMLAHTLAHVLMTEVALDCGYPASSLKERIYVPPRAPGEAPMAGLLIYTASTGEQGTLGGLVELTSRFRDILARGLERQRLCSGDPICADHEPGVADEDRALHGAACHGCLLIAETSCEARNLHLDRALLIDTVGCAGAGFFISEGL